MEDKPILFFKPGAISGPDKRAMQKAGILVIEVADLEAVKFVRPHSELSGSDLMIAAAKAMLNANFGSDVRREFGTAICEALTRSLAESP